jgi:enamine deaminase RidA (YjgF/YER057c/UK114 family)
MYKAKWVTKPYQRMMSLFLSLTIFCAAFSFGALASAQANLSPNGVKTLAPQGAIQSTGPWNLATRTGDFINVAGMRGIDAKTNTMVADPKERIRQAFLNMKLIAESEGATLQDATRLVVYVTDMFRYRPLVNEIQQELWGSGPYPPRTIIEVNRLNQDDIVEVEGTFYAPVNKELNPTKESNVSPNGVKTLFPKGAIQATGPWNLGTRAGDSIFVAGMRGIDAKTNAMIPDAKDRIRQSFLNMKLIAESEGASLQDATRIVVYVTDMFRYRPLVNEIQQELWGSGPYPPRTIVEVTRLNQDDIVEVEGTFYAPLKKQLDPMKESNVSPNGVKTLFPQGAIQATGPWNLGTRAGDSVYVAGMRGIDAKTNTMVADPKERIRKAFLNMKLIAESEGASLQDASRLIVYVTDMFRYRPLVNEVQQELWGSGPYPPRTIIEVKRLNQDDIVEVEGTFYAPLGKAAIHSGTISLYIDGKKQNDDQAPIKQNSEILVPLRSVLTHLGAEVNWNEEEKSVHVTKGEQDIKFVIGSKAVVVNGKTITLSEPVQIVNTYALIPTGIISDVFGAKVNWKEASRTVEITTSNK